MTDNSRPVTKRAGTRTSKTKPPRPDHDEIAELAYFIHLEQGDCDELANWLRAERELTTA